MKKKINITVDQELLEKYADGNLSASINSDLKRLEVINSFLKDVNREIGSVDAKFILLQILAVINN